MMPSRPRDGSPAVSGDEAPAIPGGYSGDPRRRAPAIPGAMIAQRSRKMVIRRSQVVIIQQTRVMFPHRSQAMMLQLPQATMLQRSGTDAPTTPSGDALAMAGCSSHHRRYALAIKSDDGSAIPECSCDPRMLLRSQALTSGDPGC